MAQYAKCYGEIRLLEFGGARGYRAVTWAERSEDRKLIGYFRSVRVAAEATHARFVDFACGNRLCSVTLARLSGRMDTMSCGGQVEDAGGCDPEGVGVGVRR